MPRAHALPTVLLLACAAGAVPSATPPAAVFDVIIRGGMVYDGTGSPARRVDIGINGDRIDRVGDLSAESSTTPLVDAAGRAVAPGFINMLSWSTESLLVDGRSQGDIRQGVTLEIFGEGSSMGPLNDVMKKRMVDEMGDIKYDITWTTLAGYFQELERRGVSTNVASFIGATTIREHVIGLENKPPTPQQLDKMRALVRQEMEAGALGIGSSLIYAPAFYASTDELIELCKVAAQYQGKYISHVRSEGNRLVEAVEELIRISREAKIPAEIYHLKAAGKANWGKLDTVIAMVEKARAEGLKITADMYNYPAGATGLDAAMPPWVLDGGYEQAFKRLEDPATRKKIARAISTPSQDWENLYLAAGSAGPRAARRVQVRGAQAAHRQDARRGRQASRRVGDRHDHESRARGSLARRNGVLHDVGGQHPQADPAALGVLRIRRGVDGAGAAVHAVLRAPARLRELRQASRPVRARRAGDPARRGRAAAARASPRRTSRSIGAASSARACSRTWSSSIPRRLPIRRHSRSRTSMLSG